MFKTPDQKKQEAAIAYGKVCGSCNGSGTVGIGGSGGISSSKCGSCNGSGMK